MKSPSEDLRNSLEAFREFLTPEALAALAELPSGITLRTPRVIEYTLVQCKVASEPWFSAELARVIDHLGHAGFRLDSLFLNCLYATRPFEAGTADRSDPIEKLWNDDKVASIRELKVVYGTAAAIEGNFGSSTRFSYQAMPLDPDKILQVLFSMSYGERRRVDVSPDPRSAT